MKLRALIACICLLFATAGSAQQYGNEWIDYGQQYFKIKVTQDGIYRIDSSSLAGAMSGIGVNLNSIDPRDIQMFGRETELYIHIEGEGDGTFDGSDFVEFYARANDGWMDTCMWSDDNDLVNPYHSLYNDTATYYLTWSPGSAGNSRRMVIESDVAFASYTMIDYVWKSNFVDYHTGFFQGQKQGDVATPLFTRGEGWFGNPRPTNAAGYVTNVNVTTKVPYSGAGAPDAQVRTVSASISDPADDIVSDSSHRWEVLYSTNVTVFDTVFDGYDLLQLEFTMPASVLGSNTTQIRHKGYNTYTTGSSYHAISNVTIKYPHTLHMENLSSLHFAVPHNAAEAKSYLNLTNLVATTATLYDITDTVKRIATVPNGSTFDVLVPRKNGIEVECYVNAESNVNQISATGLVPVGANGYFVDYLSGNLDSVYLIISQAQLWSSAQQYAAHRNSTGHNVLLVDVDQLYDQYGAGIVKHPIALRRFCHEIYNAATKKPAGLFLIGKSVRPHGEWTDSGARNDTAKYRNNMVPAFGNPLSDIMITSGLQGDGRRTPAIPTGRLAAMNTIEVDEYLAKVMQYETAAYDDWMKHVIHFGGGATLGEQQSFENYLLQYENVLEDTSFGGFVHTFLKNSSQPVQINVSDSVRNLINGGVSIMTFFGHASGTGFDQSIDIPSNYSNAGRYPLLIGNSCFTGDIHQPESFSTSEEWVLIADKGVIGFIASTKLGIPGDLHQYSLNLNKQIGQANYGKPIGYCMQQTIDIIQTPNDFNRDNVVLSMNLHGDPAIIINHDTMPDFIVEPTSVFFEPSTVTADVDSFDMNVILTNLGRGINDTITVYIRRELPNGLDTTYIYLQQGLLYKDTFSVTMPTDFLNGTGLNRFYVDVDIPSFIPEREDQTNNSTQADLLIITGGIVPVWPYEYAIVPDNTVTLQASTGDPFADSDTYTFEIDTTDLFNGNPISGTVTASGGVVSWTPMVGANPLQLQDSVVYFWRVTDDTLWRESSFQYIAGKEGWGQAHYFQYKDNSYNLIDYDRPERDFDFVPISKQVFCQTVGNANTTSEFGATLWKLDLDWEDNGCMFRPALHVAVIDPITLEPWGTYGTSAVGALINYQNQFGNNNNYGDFPTANCRTRSEMYFGYWQDEPGMMDTLDYLLNSVIPDSSYILIYTFLYSSYDDWAGTNLANTFQNLGANDIGVGQDSVPFIFFCQKGNPGSAIEVYGQTIDDIITMTTNITADYPLGTITSELAGPAMQWDALYWERKPKPGESVLNDSTSIEVIGVRLDGTEELMATFDVQLDSVIDLYNHVDAIEYPYLKLRAYLEDDSTLTPAQMQRWQLLYQPMPEAALNPSLGFSFYSDTVQEGEELQFAIAIENISSWDMDSMLVKYWVEDVNRNITPITYNRQDSLRVGEVLHDTVTISSEGFPGLNYLWVEANPINDATGYYDQLEQYHFNNIAFVKFQVGTDGINPILDVTFDGVHIMDGEIVSAKPNIMMTLDDENPFLILDEPEDTANFKVFLYDPNGAENRVYFSDGLGNQIMEFIPASFPENKFTIHYNPTLEVDGEYRLLVQANDKSGNESGDLSYEIRFEVINRLTVTEVMNYPNPFSTSTRFVFTLTGSEPPPYFYIQIMTVTGRVVREIHADELGQLRIGRNITDYAWDGRDNFGDQLANGIYLYRVVVKDQNNEDVELRETSASQWFNKGYGKMYLMR